jgi:hypothetical protein
MFDRSLIRFASKPNYSHMKDLLAASLPGKRQLKMTNAQPALGREGE